MIKDGKPFCDGCHVELEVLNKEEALDSFPPCGWSDWRTAHKHYCHDCYDTICDKVGFPPCDKCETHPCERGRDCWASPPLHIFPYETYFGDKKTHENALTKIDQLT